jgi:5-deoxy-D-glucuronate isomerase
MKTTLIDQAFWPIPKGMRMKKIQPAIDAMKQHWGYIDFRIHEGRSTKHFAKHYGRRRIRMIIIQSKYKLNTTDLFNFGIEFGQHIIK